MNKVKRTKVKQIISERMPAGTWFTTINGKKQYSDFFHLCNQTATIYDNAALREQRAFSKSTIELVQDYLIKSGRQYVPSVGSLSWYLNTIRLQTIKKSKNSNELGYQYSSEHLNSRQNIIKVVAKRK